MEEFKRKVGNLLFRSNMKNDSKKAMKYYRKYNQIKNRKKYVLLKIILMKKHKKICVKYNSFVPLKAKIGNGICFPHGLCGIFVSQHAVIGENCTIFQQVTIGSNSFDDSKHCGSPIIGNNVYIGTGAKVIGNVKIGNNVRIGANAVVVEDIPDNATVVLQKPRVIVHNEARNNEFK